MTAPSATSATATGRPARGAAASGYRFCAAVVVLCALANAATGFGRSFVDRESGGWMLLAHVYLAPLLMIALTGLAVLGAGRHARTKAEGGPPALCRFAYWFVLVAGLALMLAILPAMLPFFGYSALSLMVELHEKAGIVFLVAIGLWILAGIRAGRSTRT